MKSPGPAAEPLTWSHRAASLPAAGENFERTATNAECAALSRDLDLLECRHFEARYSLRPGRHGEIAMAGRIVAKIVQPCVVTLEPIAKDVEASFEIVLWPPESLPQVASSSAPFDGEEPDDPEPLVNGMVEAGRIMREQLALVIDPYPRKEGASLPSGRATEVRDSPFAVLARLKQS